MPHRPDALHALDPGALHKIIQLARKREALVPADGADAEGALRDGDVAAGRDWRELTADLFARMKALSPDAHVELVALVWLGCMNTEETWEELLVEARHSFNAGDTAYVVEKATLGSQLEAGWRRLTAANA